MVTSTLDQTGALLDGAYDVRYLRNGNVPCFITSEHAMRYGASQEHFWGSETECALHVAYMPAMYGASARVVCVVGHFDRNMGDYGEMPALLLAVKLFRRTYSEAELDQMRSFTLAPHQFEQFARQRLGIA